MRAINNLCIFSNVEKAELKQKRERLGLTQVDLAKILGVATNTISRYETGAVEIPEWMDLIFEALEKRKIEELKKSINE